MGKKQKVSNMPVNRVHDIDCSQSYLFTIHIPMFIKVKLKKSFCQTGLFIMTSISPINSTTSMNSILICIFVFSF